MVVQARMKTLQPYGYQKLPFLTSCTLVVWLLLHTIAQGATLSATVDRTIIDEQESFELLLQLDEHSFLSSPDFSVIEKDFQIANTAQSSRINMINGSMASIAQWRLTLLPKRTGKLVIPAISLGNLKSNPIVIEVKKRTQSFNQTNKNKEIYVEASVDSETLYVQSQLLFTVKLFHQTNNITDWSITEPSLNDAIIQELGEAKQYNKFINGVRYSVLERNYAIFPQSSGYFTIPPISFSGVVSDSNTRQRFGFSRGKRIVRRSEQTLLTVKPIPKSYPNQAWLPAKRLTLEESWSPQHQRFKVGEPITRIVTAKAEGLPSSMLPSLALPALSKLKAYPDKPRLEDNYSNNTTHSQRVESTAIIPTQEGPLSIPEHRVYWWNTASDKLEYTDIKKQTIQIEAGERIAPPPPSQSPLPASTHNDLANEQMALELNALQSNLMRWKAITTVLLIAVLLLVCAVLYLMTRKPQRALTPEKALDPEPSLMPINVAKKNLLAQIQTNNPETIKQALIEWAKSYYNDAATNSLGEIKQHTTHTPLIKSITRLEKKLYSSSAVNNWSSEEISNAIESLPTQEKDQGGHHNKLPNLNPI